MPTYVLDRPDAHGKTPVGPSYATQMEEGSWRIVDADGEASVYRDALPG
jgi:L-lysine 2,3-aminomutase